MSEPTKKSFIATLTLRDQNVNFLELLYGRPALARLTLGSGGFFSGRPPTVDHSDLLGLRPRAQAVESRPLALHFRHTDDGYILSVKNPGVYYGRVISEQALDAFEAVGSDDEDATIFNLITPEDTPLSTKLLSNKQLLISLKIKDKHYAGGLKMKGSPYIYLGRTEKRSKIVFALTILEREVP